MQVKSLVVCSVLSLIVLPGLIGCSRTANDITRWKAKGKTEKLIRALEDPKPEIRKAALLALGDLKAVNAVDPLVSLFDDPEPDIIVSAIETLGIIGNDPATTHLILALQLDLAEARITAANHLGTCNVPKAIEELGDALSDPETDVACAAATALGLIGMEESSTSLASGLKSQSVELRLICAQVLRDTGGEDGIKALIDALADHASEVQQAATESLVAIGAPSIPYTTDALKSDNLQIRKGVIDVLKKTEGIPEVGTARTWYQLALVSIDNTTDLNAEIIRDIALRDEPHKGTNLLQAATHNVPDIREHAVYALELLGQICVSNAMLAAESSSNNNSKEWFENRIRWNGAPSWRIDLWGALSALNPDFDLDAKTVHAMESKGRKAFEAITSADFQTTREYIPLLIDLLGDTTTPPPEQPDFDEAGMPVVKRKIDRFCGETNQREAKDKLTAANQRAVLPLISASTCTNEPIAGHAASILGEIGDKRALKPLMGMLEEKISNKENLTTSPYYIALQKLDDPITEPLLLKVRPNPSRAMQVFERIYPHIKVISAESLDASVEYKKPITYRLGYIYDNKINEYEMSFVRDDRDDWRPDPPLPKSIP